MSPLGLILMGIGILMIVIGFKGSQHKVMDAFKGIHGGKRSGNNGNSGGSNGRQPPWLAPPKLM